MKKTTTPTPATANQVKTQSQVLNKVKSALLKFRKLLTENANGSHSVLPSNKHW